MWDDGEENHEDGKHEYKQTDPFEYKGNTPEDVDLPLRPLYLHQWLDVKDTDGTWLEAQVINIEEKHNRVYVHYKGWRSTFDEWISGSDDMRLAPLHTHTIPGVHYKGQWSLGATLDVLDTTDKWMMGQPIDFKPGFGNRKGLLLMHYLGWDAKFDEWIPDDSYRLAALHAFTHPPPGGPTPTTAAQPARSPRGTAQTSSIERADRPTSPPSFPSESTVRVSDFQPSEDCEAKFRHMLQKRLSYKVVDQAGDGNCLFRSVAHQVYGDPAYHDVIRQKCLSYIEKESYFFEAYIAGDFAAYVARMRRDGSWGDHVEIQAISELYERPVQVFAYSVDPMKTFHSSIKKHPILLSYHFRSHYNSLVHPELHRANLLTSAVGVVEDAVLKRDTRHQDTSIALALRDSDAAMTEVQTVGRALELSRQAFDRDNTKAFDEAVHTSLSDFEARCAEEMKKTSDKSLLEFEEEQLFKAAIQQSVQAASEGTMLALAQKASLKEAGADGEEKALRDAIQMSLLQYQQPSAQSNQIGQGWQGQGGQGMQGGQGQGQGGQGRQGGQGGQGTPGPVHRCTELGFALDHCIEAYSIFASANEDTDAVMQNMLAYMMDNS